MPAAASTRWLRADVVGPRRVLEDRLVRLEGERILDRRLGCRSTSHRRKAAIASVGQGVPVARWMAAGTHCTSRSTG